MEENLEIVKRSTLFKTHSIYYSALGLNVTFINANSGEINPGYDKAYKTPAFHIDNLFYEKQDYKNLLTYKWENATGLGAVTGFGNLRCLDFDYCKDQSFIKKFLLDIGLPSDYEWVVRSGSHNGFHIWFKLDMEPVNNEIDQHGAYVYLVKDSLRNTVEKIELRWNAHIVLPPSVHISKKSYEFLFKDLPNSTPKNISSQKLYAKLDEICINKLKLEQYNNNLKKYNLEIPQLGSSEMMCSTDTVLFFDIETTGLPKNFKNNSNDVDNWPFIVQIAWKLCSPKNDDLNQLTTVYERDYILDCTNINIPFEMALIHGITNDIAQKTQNVIPRDLILNHFAGLIRTSSVIVCHNTDFDINVLKCELYRNEIPDPFDEQQIVCTMKESTQFCGLLNTNGNLKWPSLNELYEILFDGTFDNPHNAKNDVTALKKCFVELATKNVINIKDLSEWRSWNNPRTF